MAYTANIIPEMTSNTAPSGVASASGGGAWKAFNHVNGEQAVDWWPGSGTGWVQYQFPAARAIARYTVTRSVNNGCEPKTWTFKGSNDGSTWDTLDTQTNVSSWTSSPKVFDLANTTAFIYYRLDITEGYNASYLGVGELEMMETEGGGGGGGTVPLMTEHYSRMRRG